MTKHILNYSLTSYSVIYNFGNILYFFLFGFLFSPIKQDFVNRMFILVQGSNRQDRQKYSGLGRQRLEGCEFKTNKVNSCL